MTPTEQAQAFANLTGPDGVIARLILSWDPTGVDLWLAGEIAKMTPPTLIALALGEVIAAATYAVMSNMPAAVDRLAFLNGDLGVLGQVKARLEQRIAREHDPKKNGLILPS